MHIVVGFEDIRYLFLGERRRKRFVGNIKRFLGFLVYYDKLVKIKIGKHGKHFLNATKVNFLRDFIAVHLHYPVIGQIGKDINRFFAFLVGSKSKGNTAQNGKIGFCLEYTVNVLAYKLFCLIKRRSSIGNLRYCFFCKIFS